MGSLHNDLHSWAAKARRNGNDTISLDLETVDKIVSALTAAPDLLRVAELLVDWLDEDEGAHKLCDAARAAISKATS